MWFWSRLPSCRPRKKSALWIVRLKTLPSRTNLFFYEWLSFLLQNTFLCRPAQRPYAPPINQWLSAVETHRTWLAWLADEFTHLTLRTGIALIKVMTKNEQNIDGKCLFLITMKKCKVKINDNIFFRRWAISFKSISLLKLHLENSPSAYSNT